MDDIYSELSVQGIQLLSTAFGRDSRKVQKWEAVQWGQSFSFETSSGEGVHNSVTMLDATELYI